MQDSKESGIGAEAGSVLQRLLKHPDFRFGEHWQRRALKAGELVFEEGDSVEGLGLAGDEVFTITGIEDIQPRKTLQVRAEKADGTVITFNVLARLDSEVEVDYFRHGGILPFVLRKLMKA